MFFLGKGLESTTVRSRFLSAAAWSRFSKTVVWSPLANTTRPVHGRPSKRMAGSRSEAQPPGAKDGGTGNDGNTTSERCKDLRKGLWLFLYGHKSGTCNQVRASPTKR